MLDKATPDISVIIPAFNSAAWIRETLYSVAAQRCGNVETIVIDDGSKDETPEIVETEFRWVTLVRQENQGVSVARTAGTKKCCGRFIKYLDSDDLLADGVLERQLLLAEAMNADVVYGNWAKWVQSELGVWGAGELVERKIEDLHADAELAFFSSMWCTTSAYLWRSSFLKTKHPGWHMNLPVIQDARFPLDAVRAGGKFVHDAKIAAFYRVHNSGSVSTNNRTRFLRDCLFNTSEIEEMWIREGKFVGDRKRAVLDSYASLARNGCDDVYVSAMSRILKTDAQFLPSSSTMLGRLSRATGFRFACWLARKFEQVRRFFVRQHFSELIPGQKTKC